MFLAYKGSVLIGESLPRVRVGEALVGNEAVDQLTKFDRALRDFSASSGGKERGIDGMLVTKWDTVDDKVRASPSLHLRAVLSPFTTVGRAQLKWFAVSFTECLCCVSRSAQHYR